MIKKLKEHIKTLIVLLIIIAAASASLMFWLKYVDKKQYVPYQEFLEQLDSEEIESVNLVLDGEKFTYKTKDGEKHNTENPRTEEFKEKILLSGVEEVKEDDGDKFKEALSYVMTLIMVGAIIFMIYNMTDGLHDVNLQSDIPEITFDDIAGMSEIKEEFKDLAALTEKRKSAKMNVRMPRGILLQGPPGTGKTYMAKAFAGEVKHAFYAVNASQFGNVFAGLGAKQINNMFKTAKENAPSVIFIDEFDSLGFARTGATGAVERDNTKTLTALLANMDGFNNEDEVLVIAATNRAEDLDPALLRPGRFDKKIVIGIPDKEDRKEVIEYHLKGKNVDSDETREWLLNETGGYTPAEIESLINEAAVIAVTKGEDVITKKIFEDAMTFAETKGKEKKRYRVSEKTKITTAYHEAGHTVVATMLCNEQVTKVTIIPNTAGAGGYTKTAREEPDLMSIDEIRHHLMMFYGGYAKKKILNGNDPGKITIGCSNDMQRATAIIKEMVPYIGDHKTGALIDYEKYAFAGEKILLEQSERISREIINETCDFLKENWDKVERIAGALLQKDSIYTKEINEILNIQPQEEEKK